MEEGVTPRLVFEDAVLGARLELAARANALTSIKWRVTVPVLITTTIRRKFRLSKSPGTQRHVTANAFKLT